MLFLTRRCSRDVSRLARLMSSLIATTVSTLLVLALGVPAAYALSVHPVPRWRDGLFFFISTKMLPIVAAIGPLYVLALKTHLLDSIWVLIILYTAMNLPVAIWLIRSFMLEVPREMLEAAELDGAGRIRKIAYVSCDPATLARDIAAFSAAGWSLEALRAFDAFPMTHHVECLATLTRGS